MREAELARNELAQKLGRAPSEPEVAHHLGVEVGKHCTLLERCAQRGSLEARLECERGLSREMRDLVPTSGRPGVGRGGGEGSGAAVRAIGGLNEQDQAVTTFLLLLRGTGPAEDRERPQPYRAAYLPDPPAGPAASPPGGRRGRLSLREGIARPSVF